MRREKTIQRMQVRVNKLVDRFDECVEFFNQKNLFTGPSVYFHHKTLEKLQEFSEPSKAIDDDLFLDYLYATLTAWGLHRMGPGFTKLAEIQEIKNSLHIQKEKIRAIQSLEIEKIQKDNVDFVASKLWNIIKGLKIGIGETKIVAGSKALHHILPNLIPPIDGEYTLKFFYNNRGTALNRGGEIAFKEIYSHFVHISTTCTDVINKHIGHNMNTSKTKVIDNAIVGFVLKEFPKKKER